MLFDPFRLSGLRLRNRIVRAATYEKMADEDGHVTDELAGLYRALARGGSALIITGGALVHPSGRVLRRALCAHSDLYIKGLARLAEAVHAEGGLVALQLAHGGPQSPPLMLGGQEPLAPSAVRDPSTGITPRAMGDPEIWAQADAFGEAAWRARASGFDALELHAAHGYLIGSFLSPLTNQRDDYWGGDEERRMHFPEEVIGAVRSAVGPDFPVLVKLNCDDMAPGGLLPGEAARVARRLEAMGADAIEISGGMRRSETPTIRPGIEGPEAEAYFRASGALFKSLLHIPVILTGGLRSMDVMEDVLMRGEADLLGLCRPLIREPDLPMMMQQGARHRASCESCNLCTRFGRIPCVACYGRGGDAPAPEDG